MVRLKGLIYKVAKEKFNLAYVQSDNTARCLFMAHAVEDHHGNLIHGQCYAIEREGSIQASVEASEKGLVAFRFVQLPKTVSHVLVLRLVKVLEEEEVVVVVVMRSKKVELLKVWG